MIVFLLTSIILIESTKNNLFDFFSKEKQDDENLFKEMMEKIKPNESFCFEEKDYELAMKSKNQETRKKISIKFCKKYNTVEAAEKALTETYGNETEIVGEGSFGDVSKYGDKTAVKKLKKANLVALFKEINASNCIKKKINKKLYGNYGLVNDCYLVENENFVVLSMNYYPHTFELKIENKYHMGWDKMDDDIKQSALTDMINITEELELLHKNKIGHRDIKPENIMINEAGTPVIVDFGLTTTNGLAKVEDHPGTPYYQDYEMFKYNSIPITSDIYNLCITFAETLNGNREKIEEMYEEAMSKMDAGNKDCPYDDEEYLPNFKLLQIPNDFIWIVNMFKPREVKEDEIKHSDWLKDIYNSAGAGADETPRMTASEVLKKLKEMQKELKKKRLRLLV